MTRGKRTEWSLVASLLLLAGSAVAQTDEEAASEGEEGPSEVVSQDEPDEPAGDAEEALDNRFVQTHALQIRANPIGLSLMSDLGYRIHLFDSDSMLLEGTQLDVGISPQLSPAYVFGGPYIELTPVAFLVLRADFRGLYYFGTFGYLFEFEGVDDDWSPERVDQIDEDGLEVSATGMQLFTSETLQLKLGPVVALFENRNTWYWLDLDKPYLEPFEDLLLEPNDAVWGMSATLGYLIGADPTRWFLLVAPRWDFDRSRDTDIDRQRLGLLLLWKIPTNWWAWGEPRLALLPQVYMVEEFREYEPFFGMQLTLYF